jgi:hypothetical protein
MNIKISYGVDEIPKFFPGDSVTVKEVITNGTIKSALGFGDNVRVLLNGVELSQDAHLGDGDEITIETRANSKAVELSGPLDKQKLYDIRAQLNWALRCVNSAISNL